VRWETEDWKRQFPPPKTPYFVFTDGCYTQKPLGTTG